MRSRLTQTVTRREIVIALVSAGMVAVIMGVVMGDVIWDLLVQVRFLEILLGARGGHSS